MAREPKTTDPKTSQDAPTAPRPIDESGRTLDAWGLPENGPARARALAELGKPDPRDEPDAWRLATPPTGGDADKQD